MGGRRTRDQIGLRGKEFIRTISTEMEETCYETDFIKKNEGPVLLKMNK